MGVCRHESDKHSREDISKNEAQIVGEVSAMLSEEVSPHELFQKELQLTSVVPSCITMKLPDGRLLRI